MSLRDSPQWQFGSYKPEYGYHYRPPANKYIYPVRKLSIVFPRVLNFETKCNTSIGKTSCNAQLQALDTRCWLCNAVLVLVVIKWVSRMELIKEVTNKEHNNFISKKMSLSR
jgi:hypothetical protein